MKVVYKTHIDYYINEEWIGGNENSYYTYGELPKDKTKTITDFEKVNCHLIHHDTKWFQPVLTIWNDTYTIQKKKFCNFKEVYYYIPIDMNKISMEEIKSKLPVNDFIAFIKDNL